MTPLAFAILIIIVVFMPLCRRLTYRTLVVLSVTALYLTEIWYEGGDAMPVYRMIAPLSAGLMLLITHLPPVHVAAAVAAVSLLMVANAGRMIAASAMVVGSVLPARRGGFMSANSSVQHIASGLGAYLGGLMIKESADGRLLHYGAVGWFAAAMTLASIWLAGRVQVVADAPTDARLSVAAAAEATVDVGEPLVGA